MTEQNRAEVRPPAPAADTALPLPRTGWLADPAPLGLAGFAGTTFFLSVVNTNMVGGTVLTGVLGLAFFYGGLAQFAAGLWEFPRGNTFGATAFCSFGAFWLSYWYIVVHVLPGLPRTVRLNDVHHMLGLYLLVWTIFTAYMTIGALRVSGAVLGVFALLTLTFLALTISEFTHSTNPAAAVGTWQKVGGWLGLATAAVAWYASFAGVVNSTYKRALVPTLPR
jgi:succinate-acetate transporter protein